MTRALAMILLLSTTLPGCGEAARPRFVPASGDAPASTTDVRRPSDGVPRGFAIPKNIPMH